MPKTRKHLKKRKKGRKNSIRGGACTTKPIVDKEGRAPIPRTIHDNVLAETLGAFGDMAGNITYPHYNALAQTLSTVAENMVEDVMSEVLKEIDDDKIEGLVSEAFKRACYSTKWGSNPFIKDSVDVLQVNDTQNNQTYVEQTKSDKTNDSKEEGDRYNLLKIYMKNLGNKGESDDMMMSFFSPEVFRHAISNMGLGGVVEKKLNNIDGNLKEQIIAKIKATTEKLKNPATMEKLSFEWVDKENFNRKPIPTAKRKQSSSFIPRINIPLNLQFLINNSQLPR